MGAKEGTQHCAGSKERLRVRDLIPSRSQMLGPWQELYLLSGMQRQFFFKLLTCLAKNFSRKAKSQMSTTTEAISYDPIEFSEQRIEPEQHFLAPFPSCIQGGISQVAHLRRS